MGMLASPLFPQPLFPQERETSANPLGIYHSNRERAEASFSHLRSGIGKPIARSPKKRKSSRDSGAVRDSCSEGEKVLFEHRDTRNFFEQKADQAVRGEQGA